MNSKIRKSMVLSLVGAMVFQLTACGTIIHPERKGQMHGQLDASIVVLNAIGLFLFLVPGVIAFAVDFNNGTIYLPGRSAALDTEEINVVYIDGAVTEESIEKLILKETGKTIRLDDSQVQSLKRAIKVSALQSELRFL